MNSYEALARAFAEWADARGQLGHLRIQAARAGVATTHLPRAHDAVQALASQEAACARLRRELTLAHKSFAAASTASMAAGGGSSRRSDVAASAEEAPLVDILLVDDEPGNLVALEAVLDDPGYRLVRAASGEQALLEVLQREFACLLLDVQMPGMSGFELARTIGARRRSSQTPIIFLTAHCREKQHELEGYACGAVDYLHKPFQPALLRRKVDVFAGLHRAKRELQSRDRASGQPAPFAAATVAAAEARRRSDFLGAASRLLTHAVDIDDAIGAVLELSVPMLGDGAVVALLDDEGAVMRLAAHPRAAADRIGAAQAQLRHETERAVRQGGLLQWNSGARPAAICPFEAGGTTRGALWITDPWASDEDRLELLQQFADRVGIALEAARLRGALLEAEERRDKFVATLAHELRNPLSPISNAVQIIRTQAAPHSARVNWACDVIGRQAAHMGRLIDDLLEAARLAQGMVAVKRETLLLASIIDRAVQSRAALPQRPHQAIEVELPAQQVELEGDAEWLVHALANLLDNASKFCGHDAPIRIAATCTHGEARISVRDTGEGIAPELLPYVFDLFSQGEQSMDRPRGGLGLGLAVVRQVVELHGGRVVARSNGAGKGTEVVVYLPARLLPPTAP